MSLPLSVLPASLPAALSPSLCQRPWGSWPLSAKERPKSKTKPGHRSGRRRESSGRDARPLPCRPCPQRARARGCAPASGRTAEPGPSTSNSENRQASLISKKWACERRAAHLRHGAGEADFGPHERVQAEHEGLVDGGGAQVSGGQGQRRAEGGRGGRRRAKALPEQDRGEWTTTAAEQTDERLKPERRKTHSEREEATRTTRAIFSVLTPTTTRESPTTADECMKRGDGASPLVARRAQLCPYV